MTLQVQISDKNKSEIMSAIRLLRGVREVSESHKSRESKKVSKTRDLSKSKEEKLPIETKADYKAWKKARKELERGETISLEELERKYL